MNARLLMTAPYRGNVMPTAKGKEEEELRMWEGSGGE